MKLELVGITLILVGMLILIASSVSSANIKYGGVVMIGPIPLVFGNSKKMAITAMGIAVLLTLALLIFSQIQR